MFPETHHNGQRPQAGAAEHPAIADIIREKTNGGRLIIDFLIEAMLGDLEDFKSCHRIDAARQLLKYGFAEARKFIDEDTPESPPPGTAPDASDSPRSMAAHKELADIVRQETNGGRDAVQFLVNVMNGGVEGFKPRHRIAAAKDILDRIHNPGLGGWLDDDPVIPPAPPARPKIKLPDSNLPRVPFSERRRQDDHDFNFDSYTDYDYVRDAHGSLALDHIFGRQNGRIGAEGAVLNYEIAKKKALESGVEYHHPADQPRQPGDDPYGVDSYGYAALLYIYGSVEAVRVANMGSGNYRRRPAGLPADPERERSRPPPRKNLIWV